MTRLRPRFTRFAARQARIRRHLVTAVVVLVSVTSILFGLKFTVMQLAASRGIAAVRQGDFAGAEQLFRVNLLANWFAPWRAPYDV